MTENHVFLSFTHADSKFAESVAGALQGRGQVSSVDTREVDAQDDYAAQLRGLLKASSLVVVFVGDNFDSPWVNFEVGAALGESKVVLPVFLSHQGHASAPPIVRRLDGINATDLTPDQVAERIVEAMPVLKSS